ncbi:MULTISPECIES: hypothetical protein [Streptomyces]|uniref:Uncharacterized protein n=1 Tax=Streptomyces lasiicapitis TaxID=1923961 RepID=A0ABQ2MED6_9ACTN|nr:MULTISPECIES: hypothetical protein [Streptomyces]QIB46483.1 hypothetical protein G3H79_28800 [Streptomyces aureoverticillatus]GGO50042.1 hypothetical protein GCM10012286_49420 [Streptomyces lasiicapitis]
MRLGRAVATGIAEESALVGESPDELPAVDEIHPELTLEAAELAAEAPVEVTAGR